jgi:iron(III) transport system ATP-binding protein
MVPVTLQQVTRRFDGFAAVDGVTVDVAAGEVFFLLGPSGCGKTTLLRMIAGLTEVTAGRIRFGQRDVTRLPTARRHCAMVFQSYALWPHMTVRQNVAFGLDVRHVSAEAKARRVGEALRLVQMKTLAERRPGQLSGGQQQRVALARALVVNPDVLLLDEPLSNLDAKLRQEMRSEIRRICKAAGTTTLYVTHDQAEALSMADRIAVMHEGWLGQVGTPMEIYNRPVSRFVADFLGSTNFIPATVQRREGDALELESVVGPVRSRAFPDDVPQRGNVTCCVRPEAMRLLDAGHGADNVVTARHVDTVYLGNQAQHRFELTDGVELELIETHPRPRTWAGVSRIGFDADDVVVLTN